MISRVAVGREEVDSDIVVVDRGLTWCIVHTQENVVVLPPRGLVQVSEPLLQQASSEMSIFRLLSTEAMTVL